MFSNNAVLCISKYILDANTLTKKQIALMSNIVSCKCVVVGKVSGVEILIA